MYAPTATASRVLPRLQRVLAYRTLVKYLVYKEIKIKSRGSYLGVAWTLMNPLITIAIYFVVFRYVFRVAIPNFFTFFLVGLLPWVFFSRAITTAAGCIVDGEGIIKRAAFPLEVLPLSAVLYHLFHHAVAFGIALPLMIGLGGARVTVHLLWVAVLMAGFAVLTVAVSLWVATFGVFFRDTRDILDVTLPVLFWMTPIFYTVDMLPPLLRLALEFNPLVPFITGLRTILIAGQAPGLGALSGVAIWLVVAVGSGLWVFARYAPIFPEEV